MLEQNKNGLWNGLQATSSPSPSEHHLSIITLINHAHVSAARVAGTNHIRSLLLSLTGKKVCYYY